MSKLGNVKLHGIHFTNFTNFTNPKSEYFILQLKNSFEREIVDVWEKV